MENLIIDEKDKLDFDKNYLRIYNNKNIPENIINNLWINNNYDEENKTLYLINYLTKKYNFVLPLQKINYNYYKKYIDNFLKLNNIKDNKTELNFNEKYDLDLQFINYFTKDNYIKNISKIILKIINYKNPNKQTIYISDCINFDYIIKIDTNHWIHDNNCIKFKNYIIIPLLNIINKRIKKIINFYLNEININNYIEKKHFIELLNNLNEFNDNLIKDITIKLIIDRISYYLKF